MSLRLIMGSSGQGKTVRVIDEVIRQSAENPSKNYYIIVPEQFSLEMQRNLVERHPKKGYFNIDVMSFYRMAYRVFEECGYTPSDILEDLGVTLILRKLLSEHEDEFPGFKRSMKKAGFLDELKSMLMEFICYEVGWEQVQDTAGQMEEYPALSRKCDELGKIYEYFVKYMKDRFMVPEQILDVLIDFLPDSALLHGAIFYFDGFTGFTPVQLRFLKELLPYAGQINVTVTLPAQKGMPKAPTDREFFSFSEKNVKALLKICMEAGVEVEEPVCLCETTAPRFLKSPELNYLEKNLFRAGSAGWEKEPENIRITLCRNPEMEAEYILHKIEQYVRQKGYRYRDFAVLTGSVEEYISAFERKAEILNIPLFEDSRKKVSYHPGIETLRALFHLVQMNYSYESVFRYLKSGMSTLCDDDIDELENYVLYAGVRGYSMWKKPFTRRFTGKDDEKRQKLEKMRQCLMEETEEFYLLWKDDRKNVREKMTALYEVMCRLNYWDKLKVMADEARGEGDFVREKEYSSLFSLLVELIDKIVGIFGEEYVSAAELSEIMDAGMDSMGLGVVPLSMDQLVLGDLKRTRLPDVKVLFIVGFNEGSIPQNPGENGLINDNEKEILRECGIELSGGLEEKAIEDEFYMYLAFTRPEEELHFTLSSLGRDGKMVMPSPVMRSIRRIFPKLSVRTFPGEERRMYFNAEDSREYLIEGLKKLETVPEKIPQKKAYGMLLNYWREREELNQELHKYWEEKNGIKKVLPLSPSVTRELFGENLHGSVTKLERYAACPYQYFCTYGLEITEREQYAVYPADMGNIFHYALESFSKRLKQSGYTWKNVPGQIVEVLLDEAISDSLDKKLKEVFESSARDKYKIKTIRRILSRTIEMLQIHLKNSSFWPDRFELHFGKNDSLERTKLQLGNGAGMNLEGFVDRVDICEEDEEILIRVIDYKSGTKQFDINDMYYGLQMQLVVYMDAAREIYEKQTGKRTVPAGMYYYHLQDPLMKEESKDEEKRIRNFKMSGCTNEDPQILEQLEHGESDFVSANVRLKKDGSPYQYSSVLHTEDFQMISSYTREKIRKMGEQIYRGDILPHPYKNDRGTACDYCPYNTLCGFDARQTGYQYHILEKHSAQDVLEEIRRQVE